MNSNKRLKHMLQKYPSLMVSLPTNRSVRRSLDRSSRYRPRKPSRQLLRLIVSEALSCRICTRILDTPVTLECGDTFCKDCVLEKGQCPECGKVAQKESPRCNVLVQEVVSELARGEKDCQMTHNKVSHRYKLRSRSCSSAHEKERPLATVKRKHPSSDLKPNAQSTETTSDRESEGVLARSLDCTLCGRVLYDPITTGCGHTFCRGCVARVLDYGLACPLCMSPLPAGAAADTGVCRALDRIVQGLLPREHEDRRAAWVQEIEMVDEDQQMPVFVCTSAFPGVACPLYVYEPRYRLLTRRCLQSCRRRFAMAAPASAERDPEHQERFAAYGTVLEVRDAVHLQDGTSILTTVGVRRFKVLARGEKDGYDTATITYISDTPPSPSHLPSLRTLHNRVYLKALTWIRTLPAGVQVEITQSLGAFPPLEPTWCSLSDGPAWAWWLVPVLPLSAKLQLGFLSTTSLEKRLRAIDKLLDRMEVRMKGVEEVGRVEVKEEGCGRVEERYQPQQRMEF